jgi:hypothetical protein
MPVKIDKVNLHSFCGGGRSAIKIKATGLAGLMSTIRNRSGRFQARINASVAKVASEFHFVELPHSKFHGEPADNQ